MHVRLARRIDAPCLAMIYNQGVEDRVATFETRLRKQENKSVFCPPGSGRSVFPSQSKILICCAQAT